MQINLVPVSQRGISYGSEVITQASTGKIWLDGERIGKFICRYSALSDR